MQIFSRLLNVILLWCNYLIKAKERLLQSVASINTGIASSGKVSTQRLWKRNLINPLIINLLYFLLSELVPVVDVHVIFDLHVGKHTYDIYTYYIKKEFPTSTL